ncbi:hypothetical protein L1F30_02220 [Simiduia sp. 21SJ11W-1]|uniref:hypothetical protein n=1 Tax=Simiduia sp. 21SJ11W-1 TaxID=2909669 RepID=UPI0020A03464|nr:hypothetical protein [Simiduia sp. 21SJ11W-1]UTA48371.1 hypothetical protein L1F30_02220 [Simiduia sp. 21SJ11W-1]
MPVEFLRPVYAQFRLQSTNNATASASADTYWDQAKMMPPEKQMNLALAVSLLQLDQQAKSKGGNALRLVMAQFKKLHPSFVTLALQYF